MLVFDGDLFFKLLYLIYIYIMYHCIKCETRGYTVPVPVPATTGTGFHGYGYGYRLRYPGVTRDNP